MAADGGTGRVAAGGLVPSKTSHTRAVVRSGVLTKQDRRESRVRRMRKTVLNASRLHVRQRAGSFRSRWCMVTLTYRPSSPWAAKQIASFLTATRNYATRAGFELHYVWVMELTSRGIPHYHVLVRLPKGRTLPKPDKQGTWPHGSTRIEWARAPVGYMAKYASKGDAEKRFPRGARICGHGGLDQSARIECAWWSLPLYVREVFAEVGPIRRVKGGFVDRNTGEFLRSRFRVYWLAGSLIVEELEP